MFSLKLFQQKPSKWHKWLQIGLPGVTVGREEELVTDNPVGR